MQIINLKVEDSFFPQFKEMIENLVKDNKVKIIDDEEYDYSKYCPDDLIVSSVEEVRRRVYEAEKRIEDGDFISEEEYETQMNKFFKEELGIDR